VSLQRRLTLYFVVIVLLPLLAAGFLVQGVVSREIDRRSVLSLGPAMDASVVAYNERSMAIDERVAIPANDPRFAEAVASGDPDRVDEFFKDAVEEHDGIDFLILADEQKRVVAYDADNPDFEEGVETPGADEIIAAQDGVGPGFVRVEVPVRPSGRGQDLVLYGGFWIDDDVLASAKSGDVDISLVTDGRVVASTLALDSPTTVDLRYNREFEADLGGESLALARNLGNGLGLVASTDATPPASLSGRVLSSLISLLLVALIGTALLAYLLARMITRPLEELAEGAEAIEQGRFDHEIDVPPGGEVGKLASAFRDMSSSLQEKVTELESSRTQLQLAVRRVGETLRSTHDMSQIRESIVNTAADAVGADAAILWTFTPTREELAPAVRRSLNDFVPSRIQVGRGIVGHVAERASTVVMPSGSGASLRTAHGEPAYPYVIATPLFTQDRVTGVLAMYRREGPFSHGDSETVVFLAEQGGVAIENVMLHEDAQRLSLTDGLTGVWNRRYFQMQFRQILATAVRFEREFSVLMLDLDKFKGVNDTFGHQRGDAILVEFAQRVNETLREVDTFARYGGEEFVCILTETGPAGAAAAAEKILEAIRSEPFGARGETPVGMTVSIGVASFPSEGSDFKALVGSADRALYQAKQEGRDCFRVAGERGTGLRLA
jgi:two-component system, cell cycle response regulator